VARASTKFALFNFFQITALALTFSTSIDWNALSPLLDLPLLKTVDGALWAFLRPRAVLLVRFLILAVSSCGLWPLPIFATSAPCAIAHLPLSIVLSQEISPSLPT
jgi:hypothetical protein